MILRFGLSLLMLSCPLGLLAQEPSACREAQPPSAHGLYTFLWENDFWGGSDENYTNGNRISYSSLPQDPNRLHGRLATRLLGADCDDAIVYGLALGQNMYTPERDSLNETALLAEQHPYAGWAYAEYLLSVGRPSSPLVGEANGLTPRDWTLLSLQVGVVGPLAQQEFAQDSFHTLIGDDHFQGWDNQIGNEPALLLSYERRWQYASVVSGGPTPLQLDLLPSAGLSVGNVLVQASGGFTARLGNRLTESDLPVRIHPGASGMGLFPSGTTSLGWYAFVGMEGRLVARNIFLDGNTVKESARVEKNYAVYDRLFGVALYRNDWQFSFALIERSEEFVFQKGPHRYGSISIGHNY